MYDYKVLMASRVHSTNTGECMLLADLILIDPNVFLDKPTDRFVSLPEGRSLNFVTLCR
jgi:hypothetical protein